MERIFKVRIYYRVGSVFITLVILYSYLSLYPFERGPLRPFEEVTRLFMPDSIWYFIDNPLFTEALFIFAGLISIYSTISSFINEYTVINESLIVKEFLRREQN